MKKLLLIMSCLLPYFAVAQLNFIENTTLGTEKILLNTSASDFGPSFVENELWYSSFAETESAESKKRKQKNLFYTIFASPVDKDGNVLEGKKLMLDEISAGYHAGPVSYCKNTGELFVTLSNYENAEIKNIVFQKKNIPLKIIVLKKSGGSWIKSGELPFNNSSYSVGHPAISATGDTLIFTADIPNNGLDNTNLYMAVRKNGVWGEMVSLGDRINTSGNEMFPYLHNGKILFYASDGRNGGKGGFDIWYSVLSENGNFGEPVNFSALNTSADDFGLIVYPNEETGYFVSNRNNSNIGNDDIYKVTFNGSYELDLLVKDRSTLQPIPNVRVEFNDKEILYTNAQGRIQRDLKKSSDYTATTSIEGYMNETASFSTINQPYGTLQHELIVEKVEVGQKIVLNNIYYNFDKWDILPESETELDKLAQILNDNPSWKIELASHTDSRGTVSYNDRLSQKRSDSAVNYLKGKGIVSTRISGRGYGKSQLINQCKDGVSCSEEQHRLNRRTEFEILEMN